MTDEVQDAYWGHGEPEDVAAQNAPAINNGRFSLRPVTLGASVLCAAAVATGVGLVIGGGFAVIAAVGIAGFFTSNYTICWWRDNPIFVKHLKDVPIPKNQNMHVAMTASEMYAARVSGKMGKVYQGCAVAPKEVKIRAQKPTQDVIDKQLQQQQIALIEFGLGRKRFQRSNTTYPSSKGPYPRAHHR